jgi:hypothetical protein
MYAKSFLSLSFALSSDSQGCIEYKLQLLNPSPARFARLVTQLKWRLLEGGGHAYYELGVADSGALIGLPPAELEMSLETLDLMAGEIGASVIVVKEVEVPATIADISMAEEGLANGSRDGPSVVVDGCMGSRRPKRRQSRGHAAAGDEDLNAFVETELTTCPNTDEAVMRLETSSNNALDMCQGVPPAVTIDLEIFFVHKPRPTRQRLHTHVGAKSKRKGRNHLLPTTPDATSVLNRTLDNHVARDVDSSTDAVCVPTKQQAKAARRRLARDRRRQEKSRVLAEHRDAADIPNCKIVKPELEINISPQERKPTSIPAVGGCQSSLAPWHVSVLFAPIAAIEVDEAAKSPPPSYESITPTTSIPTASSNIATSTTTMDAVAPMKPQTRLIAEVLVVWKLPLEEAFLDFDGFSLE